MDLDASLRLADHHRTECQLQACDAQALERLLTDLLNTFSYPPIYNHLSEHLLPSQLGDLFGGLAEFACRLRQLTHPVS